MLLQVPIDCAGIFPALHLRSADRQPGDSCDCECIRLMITGFRRLYAYIRWFYPRGPDVLGGRERQLAPQTLNCDLWSHSQTGERTAGVT